MQSISAIIDRFGGNTKFAEVIGKGPSTASEMRRRESIPPEYWPALIHAAKDRGIAGVTAESLMEIAARNAARRRHALVEAGTEVE